jgi:hypothetical protein
MQAGDVTVKAGAWITQKKFTCPRNGKTASPIIYLVDSAGVYLAFTG